MSASRAVFAMLPALAALGCGAKRADPAPAAGDARSAAAPGDATPSADAAPPPLPAATIKAIDRLMRPLSGTDRPGCAIGVVRDGALVFARGYGMADVAGGVPITADTSFDLGSTSKQMTAAMLFLLVADGKLSLDDPLATHVPEVRARRGRAIAVRDLVHHVSGLPDYIGLLDAEYEDVTTTADALEALAAARPLREPGVEHEYSNSGYFLMGVIIERLGGRPFAELMAARLFAPLGMTSTRIGDGGRTPVPGMAVGHDQDRRKRWIAVSSAWQQVGDGAVISTLGDLARWDHLFEDPIVGGAALIEAMYRRGQLDDGTELAYAGGLDHGEHDGRAIIAHAGSWTGFGAELVRFPVERTSVICLCNYDDSDPESLALEIADLVLAED